MWDNEIILNNELSGGDMADVDVKFRRVNAVLAIVLVAFFFAHAILGGASLTLISAEAPVAVVWTFIGVAGIHVILCVATSYFMLTDVVRPPSDKKKRHLWIKWGSGALLAAAGMFHALRDETSSSLFLIVVLGLLTWHALVGCKSLVRDLRLPRTWKNPLRAAVIALCICAGALAFAAFVG